MIFYPGRGVDFRPAVAAAMRSPIDDKNGHAGLVGDALRHRDAEQAGADNDNPILTQCEQTHGHRRKPAHGIDPR